MQTKSENVSQLLIFADITISWKEMLLPHRDGVSESRAWLLAEEVTCDRPITWHENTHQHGIECIASWLTRGHVHKSLGPAGRPPTCGQSSHKVSLLSWVYKCMFGASTSGPVQF